MGFDMKKILAVTISLIISHIGFSQTQIFRHLNVENGLVQSQIDAIFQDSEGFMWFGTFGGLNRWDGYDFVNFQTQDGLSGNRISSLVENEKGELLVGIDGGGVNVFRNGKIDTLSIHSLLNGQSVTSLLYDHSGNLWIGTFGEGIIILSTDGTHKKLTTSDGLTTNNIWKMLESSDGTIWVGTDGGGLIRYSEGKIKKYDKSNGLGDNLIRSLFISNENKLYIGTQNAGLYCIENEQLQKIELRQNLTIPKTISSIAENSAGVLFFATEIGLFVLENNAVTLLNRENGLSADEVFEIFISKNGLMFLGTNGGGVDIYQHNKLKSYSAQINENAVLGIAETADGTFYLGTYGNGAYRLRSGKFELLGKKNGLPDLMVWSVSTGKSGAVYFSTSDGFSILKNNSFKNYKVSDGLNHPKVYSVLEASDGEIYIGTRKGLNQLTKGKISKWETVYAASSIIWSIKESADSTILICADGDGLITFKNGVKKIFDKTNGLQGDYVISALKSKSGKMFAGTDGNGLTIFENDSVTYFNSKNGLSDNTIYNIIEDKNGTIYLTTNKGVNVLTPNLTGYLIRTIQKQDGLISNENNLGSSFVDSEGNIWFGTVNGFSIYSPDSDLKPIEPPQIKMTGLKVYEKQISYADDIILDYDQNYLKFNFVGLYFRAPEKLSYQYQLVGLDKKWSNTLTRLIQYTNLNPGKYEFRVRATNEWGMVSSEGRYSFTIKQAWWKTWWFISLCVGIVIAVISYLIFLRIQQLLAVERIRSSIAADLHDNIGSSLTEVYFLSETGMMMLDKNQTEPAKEQLKKIGLLSRSLVKSMSDIVWLVNPDYDSVFDLIVRLKESYEELFQNQNISFTVGDLQSVKEVKLPIQMRQNIYLIFKEVLNNTLKYSHCKLVNMTVLVDHGFLIVRVSDDGIGFDIYSPINGNGLKNMKRRSQMIGADLTIESNAEKGTNIILRKSLK